MRKLIATVPATIVAALLALGQPALAAGPTDISGTLTGGTTTITLVRQDASNKVYDETVTGGTIGGSVTGSFDLAETVIVHPAGDFNVHGQLNCTSCTVDGASGSMTILLVATGEPDQTFQGHFTVISGTGGLANLHGEGTFQGGGGAASTYAGQVNLAP